MMTVKIHYQGDLRTEATHVRSGTEIVTDAPVDNQGKGEAFSPTDLLASSLGSCMLTLVGIAARTHGFNIDGTVASITKKMGINPRRVIGIDVILDFPHVIYTPEEVQKIKHAALTCPVALSIHPDIEQLVTFNFYNQPG